MKKIVKITDLNHNAEGIARIDNKVIFIPKTVVDDEVEINITQEYKNYNIGRIVKIKNKSEDRINPICPYFDICNGCSISNISYENELKYKKNKIQNIFKKYLDIDLDIPIIPNDERYYYRNKIELSVINNKLALHNIDNNLFNIDKCLLVSKDVNYIINIINEKIDLTNIERVTIRKNLVNEIMIIFKGTISKKEVIEVLKDKTISIINNIDNKYVIVYKNNYLIEKINNYRYKISPSSFFQVNTKQMIKLYDKVLEYANPSLKDSVLDLYCGTGTIGIYLSKYVKEVLGIEINSDSIKDAEENKKINNLSNIKFICGDVSKIINNKYSFDIVIVDPPRSGLDNKTKKVLLEIKPKKIVYVSCDPMTLVRDLKLLMNNYALKDISSVDMFSNTYHIEAVVMLELIQL